MSGEGVTMKGFLIAVGSGLVVWAIVVVICIFLAEHCP